MMMQQFQDVGQPASLISIFGNNFGVDQHFRTKFGVRMANQQHKAIR